MPIIKKPYGEIVYGTLKGEKYIDSFLIFPEFRGKGYADKLAKFLPERCWLHARPYHEMHEKGLSKDALIKFYRKLGFRFFKNGVNKKDKNVYGLRGFRGSKEFWERKY